MLKNMRLWQRIILMLVFPLIGMSLFAYLFVQEQFRVSSEMVTLQSLSDLAIKISDLVHEQQKERGATAVFIGSSGTKLQSVMSSQRVATDEKRKMFAEELEHFDKTKFNDSFNEKLKSFTDELAKLNTIRSSADRLAITAQESTAYYTGLNAKALNIIAYMPSQSSDPQMVMSLVGFGNFLQAKELAGIERATGAGGLSMGKFTAEALDKFKSVIASQNTYNQIFLSVATPEQLKIYQKVMDGADAKEVERMRAIIITGGLSGDIQGIKGDYWYETITKKINGLKEIENSLGQDMQAVMAQTEEKANKHAHMALISSLLGLMLTFVLGGFVTRTVTKPISALLMSMRDIAGGAYDKLVPYADRTHEIGQMANSVEIFRKNGMDKLRLEAQAKEAAIKAEEEKKQAMSDLASEFESNVQGIITTVASAATQLYQTADSMQKTVTNVSEQSRTASDASQQTSHNVQNVSASVEEMYASIKEIAGQIAKSSALVVETVTRAQQADAATKTLTGAVTQISSILQAVQEIAGQINLLALNATIESARAGEAGKGFAVVASEVKSLAGQTSKATEEIAKQIANVQNASKEVVEVLSTIQNAVNNVNQYSAGIASAVEEQSAATGEISVNMQQASQGVQNIAGNVAHITQGASEADHAAQEVLNAAQMLSKQSENLNHQVKRFITKIAA